MARKVKVEDPAALRDLIATNVDGIEPGLQIVETGLRLGAATVDLVALDTNGSLVLISVGSADHATLLGLVDAYLWCLVNPDNIHRLYPNAESAAVQPPRIVFVAEEFGESFLSSARQLSVTRIEAFEVQHFEVKGQSVLCFEALSTRDQSDDAAPEPEAVVAAVSDDEPQALEQSPGQWDTFLSNLGVEPANAAISASSEKPETPAPPAPAPVASPVPKVSGVKPTTTAPVKPVPPSPKPAAPAPAPKAPVVQHAVDPKPAATPVEAKPAPAPAPAPAVTPAPAKPVAFRSATATPAVVPNGAPVASGAQANVTSAARGAVANGMPAGAVPPPPAPAAGKQTRLFAGIKNGLGAMVPQARADQRAWPVNQEESAAANKLKIVRTADEMPSTKPQAMPAGTKQAPVVKPEATPPTERAVPANAAAAANARAVLPMESDEQKAVVAAPTHPALESLKFPKDGLSRQWLEFLNQLAAQK